MTGEAWITLALLIVMFGMLLASKLPTVVVMVGTLTAALTLRLAPQVELLRGFSNSGVLTVGVLYVVAAGMYSTGAVTLISDWLIGVPKSLRAAQLRMLLPVAGASAFLNNTPLVAMMIPVIRDLVRTARLSASKLYMPLSFSSILGGASTLIGNSTNLIIAGMVSQQLAKNDASAPHMREISIFVPSPVGVPAAIVGIAFIILIGSRLLPKPKEREDEGVVKRLFKAEFVVAEGSPLAGKTIEEAGFAHPVGYELTSIWRDRVHAAEEPAETSKRGRSQRFMSWLVLWFSWYDGLKSALTRLLGREAKPETEAAGDEEIQRLESGDILTFTAEADALPALWTTIGLTPLIAPVPLETARYTHRLVEAVVARGHPAVGRLVSELPVREDPSYDVALVAASRDGRPPDVSLSQLRVQPGDVGVMEVDDAFFFENRNETEFALMRRLRGYRIQRTDRAVAASVITVVMVLMAGLGWMTLLNTALLATGAMLATGCLSMRAAGRSIDFATVGVLAAAVGLGATVTSSGLAAVIAELLTAIGGGEPYIALVVVFVGCILMTNLITNAAAAALMFPIALSMAADLGVSFMPFVIVMMLGTSYAFLNPAGYQTNLMVYEPGGYKFGDYGRLGLPLTVLVGIVVLAITPIVYPFYP